MRQLRRLSRLFLAAVIEEAGGSVDLTASLNIPSDAEAFSTLALSGTAVNQVDYVLEPNQLTIPAGETTATALLTALDDTEEEGGGNCGDHALRCRRS